MSVLRCDFEATSRASPAAATSDTASGETVSWLRFNHTVDELYDVAVLAGVAQAEAIGFKNEDIQRHIDVE
jgi:hypothetical protein